MANIHFYKKKKTSLLVALTLAPELLSLSVKPNRKKEEN